MSVSKALMSLGLVSATLIVATVYAEQATQQAANTPAPAASSAPGEAAPAAPVPAKPAANVSVNGEVIPGTRIDAIAKQQAHGQVVTKEIQQQIREGLVHLKTVAQEAQKKGLDKLPETQDRLALAREQALAQALQEDFGKSNAIPDSELKAEYDSKVKEMTAKSGGDEYHVEHILVDKEADAKAIIASLKKGADFAKIAKDKSKDPGSKDKGGDLGWSPKDTYVKEFADAVAKLKKGDLTQVPVKTQFGYHIIKALDNPRPHPAPTPPKFEDVKEQIKNHKQQEAFQKYVEDLFSKAKVEDK